jgi:D,D-heptose 1,7-bisphosphate phosphatase
VTLRPATVAQCAVLLGPPGDGAAGPLAPLDGRPFLAWRLRELLRFGVRDILLLADPRDTALAAALPTLAADLPLPVPLRIVAAPAAAGTGGALRQALPLLADRFWLADGASLLDTNLATVLAAARTDPPGTGRLVLRRAAAPGPQGAIALAGDRVAGFGDGAGTAPGPWHAGGGIQLLDRALVAALPPACSLVREVLPRLAAQGRLLASLAEGWFLDLAAPEGPALARSLPARLRRGALFLDRDGVINRDHGWVGTRERFDWIPGAIEAIRFATDSGRHVFVVTNQSGVARGHYDEAAVALLHDWMAGAVRAGGGTIDDLRYCPYHPEAPLPAYRRVSDWRKPAPGMILDLIRAWEPDPARCLLIGDQPTDLAAARAAGIAGHGFAGGNLLDTVAPLLAPRPG